AARKKDGQWFLCVSKYTRELQNELRSLMDWLGVALGGSAAGALSRIPTHYIQLEEENKVLAARDRLQLDILKETHRCWRNKTLSSAKARAMDGFCGIPFRMKSYAMAETAKVTFVWH